MAATRFRRFISTSFRRHEILLFQALQTVYRPKSAPSSSLVRWSGPGALLVNGETRRSGATRSAMPKGSEPALVAEEAEQAEDGQEQRAKGRPESPDRGEAGELDVHRVQARDEGEREDDRCEHRQDAQDVVLAVLDHRLVRVLECLDDLLVVVEDVPDPLGRVDEVVEVE